MVDEEVAHLPAVPHLLDHDPADAVGVVVGGGGLEQVPLLLDGGELGVALVDDEVQERVADLLLGDLRDPLPLPVPGEVAELDLVRLQVPVLRLELVVGKSGQTKVDVLLPGAESVDPVVESRDFFHSHMNRVSYRLMPSNRGCPGRVSHV